MRVNHSVSFSPSLLGPLKPMRSVKFVVSTTSVSPFEVAARVAHVLLDGRARRAGVHPAG
jgi:hypothetical protein